MKEIKKLSREIVSVSRMSVVSRVGAARPIGLRALEKKFELSGERFGFSHDCCQ